MAPALRFMLFGWHVVVSTHALMVVAAVLAGTLVAVRRARDPGHALLAVPVAVAGALGGAQLAHRLLRGGEAVGPGGLASVGGVVGLVVALLVVAVVLRARLVDLLDAFAPAAVLALGVGRIGCFLAGCCLGAPTSAPWGLVFEDAGPLARHPLQLYSAAMDLALVVWLLRAPRTPGSVARRACVGYGVVRFVLEPLRDPAATTMLPGGVLTLPQAASLVLVVTGLIAGTGLIRLPWPAPERRAGAWPR